MTATLAVKEAPVVVAPEAPRVRTGIAVLVSSFPRIDETSILREINELERQGQPVVLGRCAAIRAGGHEERNSGCNAAHCRLFSPRWRGERPDVLARPTTAISGSDALIAGAWLAQTAVAPLASSEGGISGERLSRIGIGKSMALRSHATPSHTSSTRSATSRTLHVYGPDSSFTVPAARKDPSAKFIRAVSFTHGVYCAASLRARGKTRWAHGSQSRGVRGSGIARD